MRRGEVIEHPNREKGKRSGSTQARPVLSRGGGFRQGGSRWRSDGGPNGLRCYRPGSGPTHNIINTTVPLKLYAPPNHLGVVVHHSRDDAEAADKNFDGKTTEQMVGYAQYRAQFLFNTGESS